MLPPIFVYGLVSWDRLVYVGQAADPMKRLRQHWKTERFKRAYMIILDVGTRGQDIEARWIVHARARAPILNRHPGSVLGYGLGSRKGMPGARGW